MLRTDDETLELLISQAETSLKVEEGTISYQIFGRHTPEGYFLCMQWSFNDFVFCEIRTFIKGLRHQEADIVNEMVYKEAGLKSKAVFFFGVFGLYTIARICNKSRRPFIYTADLDTVSGEDEYDGPNVDIDSLPLN
jgi:hypothetical protein